MGYRPLLDQPAGRARLDLTCQRLPGEVKGPALALLLGMKVRRRVLFVVHSDHDPEEGRDDGHAVVYAPRFPIGSA
jgi:hypothetical protein